MSAFFKAWDQFANLFTVSIKYLAGAFSFFGANRWAVAIIALTIIVRTIVLPIAIKQIKSMRDTQRLAPEMTRLRQKYKNDRQKMTEEVMELYRREGVNPYASCLPLIAQMPVFIAMFRVIRDLTTVSKSYAKAHALAAKAAHLSITDYARAHGVIHRMPFFGLGELTKGVLTTPIGWILLVVMTGTQWFSTRQLNAGGTDQQQRMQQLMPLFFVVIMVRFPGALVLYWTTQTVYQFVQQNVMLRGWAPRKWFSSEPLPQVRPAAPRPERAEPAAPAPDSRPAPAPVPAASSFGSAIGFGGSNPTVRREMSDKRKRRRRKKRKRR